MSRTSVKSRNFRGIYIDYSFLLVVFFLLGFGLLMVYSASAYEGFNKFNSPTFFLRKQAIAIVIGFLAMVVVYFIPYKLWDKLHMLMPIVSVIFLILIKTPLAKSANGATRWVEIPGIGLQVQVAEVVKLCMILFYATYITKMGNTLNTLKGFFVYITPGAILSGALWILTNNLSSAFIVMAIIMIMYFVASKDYKFTFATLILLSLITALAVFIISKMDGGGNFRFKRIRAWLNPMAYASDTGHQTIQSLYAIGSGGIWGKGLGESMQKLNGLPESQNDMIFSILCEELGLFGAFCLMALFAILIWRMVIIANNTKDLYGAMLVVGVMAHVAVQVIMNIAVVTNTIPNTGVSLPFISYGGSSVLFLLIEMGLVLNVAAKIDVRDEA
ncbi:MAG: cell division protein FtsW [Lachnospiraceae bacterium]|nr:cell division protein FtsW [Lachnospiraceae bacterium]